jgi:two-component system CheB/CheR fusion protein
MPTAERDQPFEALLDFLKRSRGFDFTGYKRASLQRRIDKRMREVGVAGYEEYRRELEAHPDEFAQLFNTVLINVTAFFRDEIPWDFLRSDVIPRLLAAKGHDEPIRVWSAGCATGEEAYSLAMTIAEVVGLDVFRERVKIYATDVDEEALAAARAAVYTAKQVSGVEPALLEKYFERHDGRYAFRKDLRRSIIFGRNDLVQDAPISRIDLLVCRNTLMYFDVATQAKVLSHFHFALNDGGFLFLGRAETLYTHGASFAPVDLKRRLFTKVPRPGGRERTVLAAGTPPTESVPAAGAQGRLRDAAFESGAAAQVVVDRNGALALANERARALFGLAAGEVGRPLRDLELSYRPIELRSIIERAYTEHGAVTVRDVASPTAAGAERWLEVQVAPIVSAQHGTLGVNIIFSDVTTTKQLARQLEHSHQELETAYEELQSTNEELETTNEELQSTVEELETTNEELQSTNEELETMNEELHSTNEELQTINDELRRRSDELNEVNSFLESVFASLRGGVAVVDRDFHVLVWNDKAEDLWGVRSEETKGSNFLALDIGLPVEQLRTPIRGVLVGDTEFSELQLPATNRRGRTIGCRVVVSPLRSGDGAGVRGAIILMEDVSSAAA